MQSISDRGNYQVFTFDGLLKMGAEKPAQPVPPSPEDLCTIMYTSGTTGGGGARGQVGVCVCVCVPQEWVQCFY